MTPATANPGARVYDPPGGLAAPRRHWALTGLWLGMAMSALDSSIANIALPSIARDLGIRPADTTWVITAYQIAIIMTLLPVAALGERIGYHRVYQTGLLLFLLMSAGCAFAPNLEILAACRFVQGLGAAMMMGVNGAQMRVTWPPGLLGRGIGYNALVVSVTAAAGPGLAALVLSLGDWPWLFLINLPTGLIAYLLVHRFGPRNAPVSTSFDRWAAMLNAIMFGALFLAVSEAVHGSISLWLLSMIGIGLVSGTLLLRHVRQDPRPLVPLDLIRIPRMRLAYGASICAFSSQMSLLVALPFLLESHLRFDVATVGLVILPLPIGAAAAAPLAGRLADRSWAGLMSAAGLILMALATLGISIAIRSAPPVWIFGLAMALCGLGFGLYQVPNNNVMMRTAPLDRAGAAAGMLAQCRLLGQTGGALIAALVLHAAGTGSASALHVSAALAVVSAGFAARR